MPKRQTNDLGRDPVGKLLVRLALPAITAQLINALYNIVDRIYIGHIEGEGDIALTGLGITFPIIMLISAFSALIGMGGSPRASIRMGEGHTEGAEKILGNCFVSLLAVSVVLTAVFLVTQEPLLMMFGASERTLPYATDYLTIYLCGTIFVQMALGLNPFISIQGYATTSMLTVLIGAVINIALDPLFIFGFGMGVKGAALATILGTGRFCRVGGTVPGGKKDPSEIAAPVFPSGTKDYAARTGVGTVPVYHAVHGKRREYRPEFLLAAVRRRPGGWRHDHLQQRDAGGVYAPAGSCTGQHSPLSALTMEPISRTGCEKPSNCC